MNYDLLIHVDTDCQATLDLALGNIQNYYLALPGETFRVVLVANGKAPKLFTKDHMETAKVVARLRSSGASFRVCANALKKFDVPAESLIEGCEIVPAGIVEVVKLQREEFAYVKP